MPGENWDFTATQSITLADVEFDGAMRKVLMQAPKNGLFYVLDRATGELLAADKIATANWASHVDMKTGRPVETGLADYEQQPRIVFPSPAGAHIWQPQAWHVPLRPGIWNGGVLATAGNLVFQGTGSGYLHAYHAPSGVRLKSIRTGTGIIGAPMSYAVDSEQYIAVMAGWGGGSMGAFEEDTAVQAYVNDGRILAFKLGGGPVPLPPPRQALPQ